MTAAGVQASTRIMTFLQPPLSGPLVAAIVYRPGDAQSEAEAQIIERALAAGTAVGKMTVKSRRIATNALADLAGAKIAFVTQGSNYRGVASAAGQHSILTISADPACVKAGLCVVAINSVPKVQILVSKAASTACNLKFGSAFLMLVREM